MRVLLLLIVLCFTKSLSGAAPGTAPLMPLAVDQSRSATARQLQKPVLESKLLDDMEDPARWSHRGFGQMSFTTERAKDGTHSLRLTSPTLPGKPVPHENGRPFVSAPQCLSGRDCITKCNSPPAMIPRSGIRRS